MKKRSIILLTVINAAILVITLFLNCADTQIKGTAGIGLDTNEYYTKAEIDEILDQYVSADSTWLRYLGGANPKEDFQSIAIPAGTVRHGIIIYISYMLQYTVVPSNPGVYFSYSFDGVSVREGFAVKVDEGMNTSTMMYVIDDKDWSLDHNISALYFGGSISANGVKNYQVFSF